MRLRLLAVLLALFVASPVLGQADWTPAFEAEPADNDLVSAGAGEIRGLKVQIHREGQTEHDFGWAGAFTDTGRHLEGSCRTHVDAAAPANYVAAVMVDRTGSGALDDGRLWVDEDDAQPYFRDQSIATDLVTNEYGGVAAWASLWPLSFTETDTGTTVNQTNGAGDDTREAIDGTLGGTDLGVSLTFPDDGRSYEYIIRADIKYSFSNGNRMGFWISEDCGAAADIESTLVGVSGATDIIGTASLVYVGVVGVDTPVLGDTCTYTVEWACLTAASCYVNPNQANVDFNHALGVAFAAATSESVITGEVRPRYATY